MIAEMADLPLWLEQLRSSLSDEERRRSSCHGSRAMISSSAKAKRSRGESKVSRRPHRSPPVGAAHLWKHHLGCRGHPPRPPEDRPTSPRYRSLGRCYPAPAWSYPWLPLERPSSGRRLSSRVRRRARSFSRPPRFHGVIPLSWGHPVSSYLRLTATATRASGGRRVPPS